MSLQRMGLYRITDVSRFKNAQLQDYIDGGLIDSIITIEDSYKAWNSDTRRGWGIEMKTFDKAPYLNIHDPYKKALGVLKGVYKYYEGADFDYKDRWFKNKSIDPLYKYSGREIKLRQDKFFDAHYIFGEPKRVRPCI